MGEGPLYHPTGKTREQDGLAEYAALVDNAVHLIYKTSETDATGAVMFIDPAAGNFIYGPAFDEVVTPAPTPAKETKHHA